MKNSFGLFEVKSIHSKNEISQIRHAVAQLLEYRYMYNKPDASLWVVLSSKPSDFLDEHIKFIREDRKMNLLWVENSKLTGPDINKLI